MVDILKLWERRSQIIWTALDSSEVRAAGSWVSREAVEDAWTTVLIQILEKPSCLNNVEDVFNWVKTAVITTALKDYGRRALTTVEDTTVKDDGDYARVEAAFTLEQIFGLHLTDNASEAVRVHYIKGDRGKQSWLAYKSFAKLKGIYGG